MHAQGDTALEHMHMDWTNTYKLLLGGNALFIQLHVPVTTD